MIVARGRKQHGFDVSAERLCSAGQKHMANYFSTRRAAGFARQFGGKTKRFQTQRQHGGLGGFAGSFAALKGDEFALHVGSVARVTRARLICIQYQYFTAMFFSKRRKGMTPFAAI
jgi:hypothetical protein